jgi:DNA-binding LacI/PurR family transcriptional regulator
MEILAAQRNLRFILGHAVGSSDKVWRYLEDFRTRGVDGIISFFHSHPDYSATVLPELARFENVVYFERPLGLERFSDAVPCYVQPDYEAVGRLGTQHLLETGRRRIAMVMNDLAFPYATARQAAYRGILEESGIGYRENRVWVMDRQPGMHWGQPFDATRALMAIDEVVLEAGADAILAVNDMVAARLIVALRQRGRRVPDDVAIVGCDNLEVSTVTDPMITSIDLRSQVLAESTMQLLFRMLDDKHVPEAERSVTVEPVLVVRNSSA